MSTHSQQLSKKAVLRLMSTGHVYSSELTASGELQVCVYENGVPYILDKTAFDLIHERLYPILVQVYNVDAMLDTTGIRLLVRFLESPPYVLPTRSPAGVAEDAYMSSISYFAVHEDSLRFEANGGQYIVERTALGDVYPTGFKIGDVNVAFKRMDAMYPGWLLRYKMAEGLGLVNKSVLAHMLSDSPVVMPQGGADLPLDL